MTSSFRIRATAGWTMFVFGATALLLGLLGLVRPELLLSILGFSTLERATRSARDYTLVFATASFMASYNIGVYSMLAALHDMKPFYRWTGSFRFLTFLVFTTAVVTSLAPARFIAVGVWELTGAIATGPALRTENKK